MHFGESRKSVARLERGARAGREIESTAFISALESAAPPASSPANRRQKLTVLDLTLPRRYHMPMNVSSLKRRESPMNRRTLGALSRFRRAKSLFRNILRVSPYSSKILMVVWP